MQFFYINRKLKIGETHLFHTHVLYYKKIPVTFESHTYKFSSITFKISYLEQIYECNVVRKITLVKMLNKYRTSKVLKYYKNWH